MGEGELLPGGGLFGEGSACMQVWVGDLEVGQQQRLGLKRELPDEVLKPQFWTQQSQKDADQPEISSRVMQTTDTAHGHGHGTVTAHSHSTVTAQSQSPPISTRDAALRRWHWSHRGKR